MLVVDPTVVLPMLAAQPAWTSAGSDDLVAPPLLWSECRSLLHDLARRGTIPAAEARRMRRALDRALRDVRRATLAPRMYPVAVGPFSA